MTRAEPRAPGRRNCVGFEKLEVFGHRSAPPCPTLDPAVNPRAHHAGPASALDSPRFSFRASARNIEPPDDRCRPRERHAVHLHGAFTRWANSRCIHWCQQQPNGCHLTTTDHLGHFAAGHDRPAIRALTAKRFSW